jgi:hypothetical protein
MTSKKDHLVKIRAKSDLSGTGVTDDIARQMCHSKGKHYMAVVEVKVDELHDKSSGQQAADLIINQFWPANDDNLDEHLRELTRVLHQNKALASEHDDPIDGMELDGPAPTVSEVLEQGAQLKPHDYLEAADGIDQCDVCGQVTDAPVHASVAQLADPFSVGDTAEDDDDPDGPYDDDPDGDAHEEHEAPVPA